MLNKYYSLDECSSQDAVYDYLEGLQEDGKVHYEVTSTDDVIKIKDTGLSDKEMKALINFFESKDVIKYVFDDEDEDEFFEEDEYGGYDDYNEDEY